MSNDKQRRRAKRKEKARKRQQSRPHTTARRVKVDVRREVDYITARAQAGDGRFVTLGKLVFFSTQFGDAWVLDAEDHFAACVCRDYVPQPLRILETPDTFGIEWPASFAIEGEDFVVQKHSGGILVKHGYPTPEILAACGGR